MKRYFVWLLAITMFSSFRPAPASPTAGVYLYVNGVTTGCGVDLGHTDEVALLAVSNGFSRIVQSPGGGGNPTVGTPAFSDLFISKMFDKSSLRLQHYALDAGGTKDMEIRYYDGVSPTAVYKIVLDDVIITTAANSNTDCTSGCPGIGESFSFNATKVAWHNFKTIPAQVLTYSLVTGETTFTQ